MRVALAWTALLAGCAATESQPVVTGLAVERTTETQDVVEALIREGLMPLPERAGARFLALYEDRALTRYCVRFLEPHGAPGAICAQGRDRIEGVGFADACFRHAVIGDPLPDECGLAIDDRPARKG
ncbi:MAG: hypothetical protein O3B31_10655 [Chloroflexi bacterium]|nr:hypothetical protein [Chloroflexota bacterium]MDA1003788.1 hypothetical protein [Chloroflexota bacterium]